MIHPLLLAYARAKRAEHLAAVRHAPTGVASPAMTTHRAYAAWAAAGFPVEADRPRPGALSPRDLTCPGCRREDAIVYLADGHTFCRFCSFDTRHHDDEAPR